MTLSVTRKTSLFEKGKCLETGEPLEAQKGAPKTLAPTIRDAIVRHLLGVKCIQINRSVKGRENEREFRV